jgi:CheY-like chemotaxis protein
MHVLAGLRVLVVDDDADEREMYTVALGRCGAEVVGVTSASRALEILEREQIDVLVSDICLPGADGYHLIEEVRRRAAGRDQHLGSVAVTGLTTAYDRVQAIYAGFDMYLTKPVSLETLVAAVGDLARAS